MPVFSQGKPLFAHASTTRRQHDNWPYDFAAVYSISCNLSYTTYPASEKF